MIELLNTSYTFVFWCSLAIMIVLGLIEIGMTLIGVGISDALDSGIDDIENVLLAETLTWFNIKELPFLVALIIFLLCFGVSGLVLQSVALQLSIPALPYLVTVPAALFSSLTVLKFIGGIAKKMKLKIDTESINTDELIGLYATITTGIAREGSPAEARVKDKYLTTHYVMVEPDDGLQYNTGEQLLLVERKGPIFKGISPKKQ